MSTSKALSATIAMSTQKRQSRAAVVGLFTSSQLHAPSRWKARYAIRRHTITEVVTKSTTAVGIVARKVEQVNAGEDYEEAAEEGDCVDGRRSVETAEEEERGDECAGCEGDVIERVNTISRQQLAMCALQVGRTCWSRTG